MVPEYEFDLTRPLTIEQRVGGRVLVRSSIQGPASAASTGLPQVHEFGNDSPLVLTLDSPPEAIEIRSELQGTPGSTYLLVTTARQNRRKDRIDVAHGILNDSGRASHLLALASRAGVQRVGPRAPTPVSRLTARVVDMTSEAELGVGNLALELVERASEMQQVRLTDRAKEMLLVPLLERASQGEPTSRNELLASMERIVREAVDNPASVDAEWFRGERVRSSLSIVRAYWSAFCNIPPFCGPGSR